MLPPLLFVGAVLAGPEPTASADQGEFQVVRPPAAVEALGPEEYERLATEVDEKAKKGFLRVSCPTSSAQVEIKVNLALAAYQDMDGDKYDQLRAVVGEELTCLTEVASPELVRGLHLLQALQRFSAHNKPGTLLALRGMRTAAPAFRPPASLISDADELGSLYEQSGKPGKGEPRSLLQPKQGALLLDGVDAGERPLDRAALMQWAAPSGQICWSGYLDPGQSLPATVVAAAAEEGGLFACIESRKCYHPPSVDPIPEAPAVSEASFPGEGDDSGSFAEMFAMDAPAEGGVVEGGGAAEVQPPDSADGARRVRPLARLGGVFVAAGQPADVSWAAGGVQPAGYSAAGIEALLGAEVRIGERFGLLGGLGWLSGWAAAPEETGGFEAVGTRVNAGELRAQAALRLGRVAFLAGPAWRVGATRGCDQVEEVGGMVCWEGSLRSLGLVLDADVDLGEHAFAYAGGSFSSDIARTWTAAGLGVGWRL